MTVTVEDLYELATLYLIARHDDQDQRRSREDAFKKRLPFLSEADPENHKYIQLNLGNAIERLRARVQGFFAANPDSLPHAYLEKHVDPIYAYTHPYDAVPHLPPLNLEYESPRDAITLAEGEAKWSRWFKLRKNHSIERYRLTLGKKTKDEQFDPDVYFTALFAELIDTHRQLGQPFPFGLRN